MNKLLHWWRLLVEPSGMGRLRGFGPKRWRVVVSGIGPTTPMAYDEACNYRDIANMGADKSSYIERVKEKA